MYNKCAEDNGQKKLVVQPITWENLKPGVLHGDNDFKPIFMDSRKKLRYKFSIYMWGLQWSSSLKRILASGSILIMPTPNPHESLVSRLLAKHCSDCYVTVLVQHKDDTNLFCDELKSIVKNFSRDDMAMKGREMSAKLTAFAQEYLSLNATLAYMHETLSSYASSKHLMNKQYSSLVKATIKDKNLVKFDCGTLHKTHLNPQMRPEDNRLRWQYKEWYDEDCRLISNSTYLMYTAI